MYADNDWYGHKRILADYCGLDRPRPIFGSMRHGWELFPPTSAGHQRLSRAPVFFWNSRHRDGAKANGVTNASCVGAPFAYLMRSLWPSGPPRPGSGTILFPSHSHEGTSYDFSVDDLTSAITKHCPAPYTVSVFYQELDSPRTADYRDRGWRVVSFGSRGTPLFLHRQAAELAAHAHVVGNVMQTAILYGAILGRSVRVLGPTPILHSVGPGHDETVRRTILRQHVEDAPRMFPGLHSTGLSGQEAIALGRSELGDEFVQDPEQLRSTLGWSSPISSSVARVVAGLVDLRLGRDARRGVVGHGR